MGYYTISINKKLLKYATLYFLCILFYYTVIASIVKSKAFLQFLQNQLDPLRQINDDH